MKILTGIIALICAFGAAAQSPQNAQAALIPGTASLTILQPQSAGTIPCNGTSGITFLVPCSAGAVLALLGLPTPAVPSASVTVTVALSPLTAANQFVYYNTASGAISQPLPALASLPQDQEFQFVKVTGDVNQVIFVLAGSDTFCGFTALSLTVKGASLRLKVDHVSGQWMVL